MLLQILIAGGFAAAALILSVIFGKSAARNPTKDSAYECGMLPVGPGQARFSVKFYLVAMLFVIFDIEVVFLYPWAVTFNELAAGAVEKGQNFFSESYAFFWGMTGFLGILFIAYLYALKKGALRWN